MTQATDTDTAVNAPDLDWTQDDAATRTCLRLPREADSTAFTALMQRSRRLHHPWIQPPVTGAGYLKYLQRVQRMDHAGFLVCERHSGELVGVINLNQIVHGAFLSATLGYYAGVDHAGRGLMGDGLNQVVRVAFRQLGLHRLEANIQPRNSRSINLVKRAGFRREGFSPRYLFIDGAWRDHERWALVDDRERLLPHGVPRSVAQRFP